MVLQQNTSVFFSLADGRLRAMQRKVSVAPLPIVLVGDASQGDGSPILKAQAAAPTTTSTTYDAG